MDYFLIVCFCLVGYGLWFGCVVFVFVTYLLWACALFEFSLVLLGATGVYRICFVGLLLGFGGYAFCFAFL